MKRNASDITVVLSAKHEGMQYSDMDTGVIASNGVDEFIDGLRAEGYRIFYVCSVDYVMDDNIAYV